MHIIDLHCDTLYKAVMNNMPLDAKENEVLFEPDRADCKLQCYAIWLPDNFSGEKAEQTVFAAAGKLREECDRLGIRLLHQGDDIHNQFAANRNTAILTIENGSALNGKIENVQRFSDMGVKMMTLTWNAHNRIGDGADVKSSKGITAFGCSVLQEMERTGIIVDVSHASEKLFYDVAENTQRPFVASHSNAYSITRHRRNLTDEQFKVFVQRNGLVGINFHNAFLNDAPDKANINDIIRHIEHFLALGGEDCLCFGSDFDGGTLPKDIKNSRIYNKIYEMCLKQGYSDTLIRKIFYKNALKFFENFDNHQIM